MKINNCEICGGSIDEKNPASFNQKNVHKGICLHLLTYTLIDKGKYVPRREVVMRCEAIARKHNASTQN